MRRELERLNDLNDPSQASVLGSCHLDFKIAGLGFELPKNVKQLKQVHGNTLIEVKAGGSLSADRLEEGDGLFTCEPGLTLGIRTADCLPVILASTQGDFVCVIHAGWRGLCQGILASGVKTAASRTQHSSIRAFLGPCIGMQAFEVGGDVMDALASRSFGLTEVQQAYAADKGRGDRWHVNLGVAASFNLMNAGLKPENISVLRSCTYLHADLWHSYRRTSSRILSNWTLASLKSPKVFD